MLLGEFNLNEEEVKMHKQMKVEMSDGSIWAVPVEMIARHRAKHYAHEFDGDIEKSLAEDTIPLFESDDYEIEDWAVNNMNWSDFEGHRVMVNEPDVDYDDGWCNGDKTFA